MVSYAEQIARTQRTQDFLQRQIDLSDENKSDVLDALLNNTWGTQNQFYIGGNPVDRSDTSINLEAFLLERGIDPKNLPEFVGSDIFRAEKLTATRQLSRLIGELGGGVDLREIAEIERSTLYGLSTPDKDRTIADLKHFLNAQERAGSDVIQVKGIARTMKIDTQQNGGEIPFYQMGRAEQQQSERDPQPQASEIGTVLPLAIGALLFLGI